MNREKYLIRQKQRSKTPEFRKRVNERDKNRRRTDLNYRIRGRIVARIKRALNNHKNKYKKSESTLELLGCSIEFLRIYLQSKFTAGMNWENHGYYSWHIDHIIPCAAFDLSDPEQQKKCFHYSNLQPLWWRDNLSKGSKIIS